MPPAHSVSCQLWMEVSIVLQTMQCARIPSSSVFTTHIKPGHGLPFGRRLHSTSVSRVSFFRSAPSVFDEPCDAQHPAVEAGVVDEEVTVSREPVPRIDDEHGAVLPTFQTSKLPFDGGEVFLGRRDVPIEIRPVPRLPPETT